MAVLERVEWVEMVDGRTRHGGLLLDGVRIAGEGPAKEWVVRSWFVVEASGGFCMSWSVTPRTWFVDAFKQLVDVE